MKIENETPITMRLGLIAVISISLITMIVSITSIYSEHRDIPKRVLVLEKRSLHICFAIKNLQDKQLHPNERYNFECLEQ